VTPGEKKVAALVTRYRDGAAVGMRFTEPHLLDLAYEDRDGEPPRPIRIDFRAGVVSADASIVAPGMAALGNFDQVAGVAAVVGTGASIEVTQAVVKNSAPSHPVRAAATPQKLLRCSTLAGCCSVSHAWANDLDCDCPTTAPRYSRLQPRC